MGINIGLRAIQVSSRPARRFAKFCLNIDYDLYQRSATVEIVEEYFVLWLPEKVEIQPGSSVALTTRAQVEIRFLLYGLISSDKITR
jgi:hypothetical protein